MAFRGFQIFFQKYPVTRGIATSSIIWPISNFCQQSLENRKDYDFAEMARFCIFGTIFSAPSSYIWMRSMNTVIPGRRIPMAISKAAIGQLLYSPFYTCIFYLGLGAAELKPWGHCLAELKKKFWPTFATGAMIWPLSQTICYAFVKEKNHVPILATVGFFWTMYLSYMKNLETNLKTPTNHTSTDFLIIPVSIGSSVKVA